MVESPVICPYCGDNALKLLPGAELIAMNAPKPRVVSQARIYRCSAWHVFAVFPKQIELKLPLGA